MVQRWVAWREGCDGGFVWESFGNDFEVMYFVIAASTSLMNSLSNSESVSHGPPVTSIDRVIS